MVAATLASACVHNAPRATDQIDSDKGLQTISASDRSLYDVVLARIALEYGAVGDTIRVERTTMVPCDTTAQVYYLDCTRERNYGTLERRSRDGSWAFSAFINDSTRRQLAESFRANSGNLQLLAGLDTGRFVLRSRAAIEAARSAWASSGGRPIASIVLSRAGYSQDGHAYVYAVFSRTGYGRGAFAAGLIFLLKRSGDIWALVATSGVWVT
jgi:hypothetical protein